MKLRVLVANFLVLLTLSFGQDENKEDPPPAWPQFDEAEHVPGEPLTPIDYQNAELQLNIPPPNTIFNKDPIELAGLFEGDIILTEKDHAEGYRNVTTDDEDGNKKNAIIRETLKWPGGVIPYFISAQFGPVERSTIARAILEYQRQTCIIFRPRTTERDYIHITKGNGCSSHVGRTGGAQPVILGNGCVYPGIAMHELMHAAGFWHEQSRWDRDQFVQINYQNIKPSMAMNFKKYSWNQIQSLGVEYDTSSILHYGPYAFAKDRRYPTIVPKVPNSKMGQRVTFTQSDVLKINRLYGCKGATIPDPVNPNPAPTTPKPTAPQSRCVDNSNYCSAWSARGECQKNPAWMLVNCKKSCNRCQATCSDHNNFCSVWAQRGECSNNPDYMKTYCPKSCGVCPRDTEIASDAECEDLHVHCNAWADRGECTLNPNYMLKKCKKSCNACNPNPEQKSQGKKNRNKSTPRNKRVEKEL